MGYSRGGRGNWGGGRASGRSGGGPPKMPFGDYKGFTIAEIAADAQGDGLSYLQWLIDNNILDEQHPQYGSSNRTLNQQARQALGLDQAAPATRTAEPPPVAAARATAAAAGGGEAVKLLKEILGTLRRIEVILANPDGTHVAGDELAPDDQVPPL